MVRSKHKHTLLILLFSFIPYPHPILFSVGVELGTTEYAAIFALTIIPSLAFVKFVGDQADTSRSSMTENQKAKFQKVSMTLTHEYRGWV